MILSLIEDLLDELNSDMESGARELALKTVKFFKKVIQTRNLESILGFIDGLRRVKPTMAPIQNLREIFGMVIESGKLDFDQIMIVAERVENLIEESNKQIYSNLLNSIDLTESTSLMTISRSSTVEYVIQRLCGKNELGNVFVPVSHPLNEGITLARNLAAAKCNVHLIPDFAVAHYIQKTRLILVGADAIIPEGFANKIGTKTLAITAHHVGVPFIVLADFLKIQLEEKPLKFEFIDAFPEIKDANIKTTVPLFELLEHEYVAMYVTNIGVFKGNEMENMKKKISEMLGELL